jgi:hypothetical protein
VLADDGDDGAQSLEGASEAERASRAWCAPRRPVLRSCRWALSAEQKQAILTAREKPNWGRCG